MKNGKPIVAILLSLVLCMSGMVGLAESAQEPVTLRVMWCQGTNASGLEETIEQMLSEQYPHISVEWEITTWEDLPSKMQQYMQSGMPDVVIAKSQDANNYGGYGVWADLSDTDYIGNVLESCLGGVTIDGKILGMPYIGTYGGVYYNREIFEQNNITIPTTTEEFKAVCETLKAAGITPIATHWLDSWFLGWELAIVSGGELMSTSLTWGDEFRDGQRNAEDPDFKASVEMMEYIHQNTWEDTYSVEQTTCDARFVQGQAAMQMDGSWVASNYAMLNPDFDYGLFPFPNTNGDGCLNMEPNDSFFKSATTENHEAADAFLSMMASPEMASAWSQYVGESSLIKGATSFATPAQSDIGHYAGIGLSRDQNAITNQLPYNEFWGEVANDFTEYINGDIAIDVLYQRANDRRSVCGE
ncbi:extracellular solute-binding protein [Eubacteriales bacterium OttesenSCG-928-N13]|nr:extracellular solute-binding protein [Eubacteriales bacterium OttesenSCG-928-N13]